MSTSKDALNIGELKSFVETCREQGIDDNKLVNMAVSLNKWDKGLIEAFVQPINNEQNNSMLNVVNDNVKISDKPVKNISRPQLSAILMVIHHISLWIFLLTAVPLIIALISLIFSSDNGFFNRSESFETLISFIVVLLVTGGLYGGLFFHYFKKLKYNPELQTGRIFSLINIALSLITVIISTIVLIVTIVNYLIIGRSDESSFPTNTVAIAISIIILYGGVYLTYFASDFMKPTIFDENKEKVIAPKRKIVMLASVLTSFFLLITLLVISFTIMPNTVKDSKTVNSITSIVRIINDTAEEEGKLLTVDEFNDLSTNPSLEYQLVNEYEYVICADFHTDTSDTSYNGYLDEDKRINDNYAYGVEDHEKGKNCFNFYNDELEILYNDANNNAYYDYNDNNFDNQILELSK